MHLNKPTKPLITEEEFDFLANASSERRLRILHALIAEIKISQKLFDFAEAAAIDAANRHINDLVQSDEEAKAEEMQAQLQYELSALEEAATALDEIIEPFTEA